MYSYIPNNRTCTIIYFKEIYTLYTTLFRTVRLLNFGISMSSPLLHALLHGKASCPNPRNMNRNMLIFAPRKKAHSAILNS